MVRPVTSAVRIRSKHKQCFYPDFGHIPHPAIAQRAFRCSAIGQSGEQSKAETVKTGKRQIRLRPEDWGYRRLEGGTTLCKGYWKDDDIRLQSALSPYSLLNKSSPQDG